jgi:hypothetical protein
MTLHETTRRANLGPEIEDENGVKLIMDFRHLLPLQNYGANSFKNPYLEIFSGRGVDQEN